VARFPKRLALLNGAKAGCLEIGTGMLGKHIDARYHGEQRSFRCQEQIVRRNSGVLVPEEVDEEPDRFANRHTWRISQREKRKQAARPSSSWLPAAEVRECLGQPVPGPVAWSRSKRPPASSSVKRGLRTQAREFGRRRGQSVVSLANMDETVARA
jgi:hypothetical protein